MLNDIDGVPLEYVSYIPPKLCLRTHRNPLCKGSSNVGQRTCSMPLSTFHHQKPCQTPYDAVVNQAAVKSTLVIF